MAALRSSLFAVAVLVAPMVRAGDEPADPPYPHRSVTKTEIGSGPKSYFLFEPAGPIPKRAPVVVFQHG